MMNREEYYNFQKEYHKRLWPWQRKKIEKLFPDMKQNCGLYADLYQFYPVLFLNWHYNPLPQSMNRRVQICSFCMRLSLFVILCSIAIYLYQIRFISLFIVLIAIFFTLWLSFLRFSYACAQKTAALYLVWKFHRQYPELSPVNPIYIASAGYGPVLLIACAKQEEAVINQIRTILPNRKIYGYPQLSERKIILADGFVDADGKFYCQYLNTMRDTITMKENMEDMEKVLDVLFQRDRTE